MEKEVKYREVVIADLPQIVELLEASSLPSEDCGKHLSNFYVVELDGQIIGVGGLEICGHIGLVRSIAVALEYRNRGFGLELYQSIERRALKLGINELYLLTDSAVDYFAKLGFSQIPRTHTPAEIAVTNQFRELCPDSATVMRRNMIK